MRFRLFLGAVTLAVCYSTSVAAERPEPPPLPEDPAPREFYTPIERELEGWTIKVDPQLLAPEHDDIQRRAFAALRNHLERVAFIVPPERLAELRRLPIWIELDNPDLKSMQYHPSRDWLSEHGHDPRLEKHVHIPHADALFARRTWAKHPYVILHELAHAYHDQVLSFEHKDIRNVYNDARDAGIYEEVLLHTGRKVRHYGLTNHKEYFAEMTEAYLGVNDFYPFVRAELQQHDPAMYQLLQTIWGPIE